MSSFVVLDGALVAVTKDAEEGMEEYWDRAWAFAALVAGSAGRPGEGLDNNNNNNMDREREHAQSRVLAARRRGAVFPQSLAG